MKKKNSYQFDNFRDTKNEARLLEVRANRDIGELIPALKRSGLTEKMRVLDLGSGTGRRSELISRFVRCGEVLGIDQSDELLDQAKARIKESKLDNISFEKADIMSYKSLRSLGKFDFVYIRLVIQHLKDPLKALANINQIMRPGGIIFLEDTDRDWVSVVPEIPAWEKMYRVIKDGQTKRGGDPRSGRKLGYYLATSGFTKLKLNMLPVCGSNSEVLNWLDNYVPSYLIHLDAKKAASANEILKKIRSKCLSEPMFFYQTWFQASGVKL
jgi:ubiquinone/menaquinone biosynthesis C-methylase UbiE